jgi:hypothetical protein
MHPICRCILYTEEYGTLPISGYYKTINPVTHNNKTIQTCNQHVKNLYSETCL